MFNPLEHGAIPVTEEKHASFNPLEHGAIPVSQERGDSWSALIPKALATGITDIGDVPKLLELPHNLKYGENNSSTEKAKQTLQNLDPHTYDFDQESLWDRLRSIIKPKPNTANKRVAAHAAEFAGGSLMPFGNVSKTTNLLDKFKNTAKIAGMGATIGGASGVAQEKGVNPLLADIGASIAVPTAGGLASAGKELGKQQLLKLSGVGVQKLNVDALKAAKDLGIELPTAAATNSALVDLTDQAVGKIPFLGDKLKKKYAKTEKQTLKVLDDIYNQVGPKETDDIKNQISKLYEQSINTLPDDATIIPSNTLQSIGDIRKKIVTPIPNEGEKKLLSTLTDLEAYYHPEIEAPVKSIIGSKKSLNSDIDWDKHQGVRNLLKNVKHSLSEDINQYGNKNKDWHKNFTEADELFGKVARRKELEELFSGKAINAATDSFSYNSLSKIIHADKTDNKIRRLVDPQTYKKIKKLGEVTKAMAQKSQRTPNPSGTAPTAAALTLLGGMYTAPLSTVGTGIGATVATKLLTDQKFLDYALKIAEQQTKGNTNLLDLMKFNKRVKTITGQTPVVLSRELQRKDK